MNSITFQVERRETSGKSSSRKIRRDGQIPAIIYGKNTSPIQIQFDPKELQKQLDNPKRMNSIFALNLPEEGETFPVMIKELQVSPLSKKFLHIDFQVISDDQAVSVNVPIELQGNSAGVKAGGKLELLRRKLRVRCLPEAIPAVIPIDITEMKIGGQLRIKDLKLDESLQADFKDNFAIVRVKAGRDELEDEEEEGEENAAPAEGEEKAEG